MAKFDDKISRLLDDLLDGIESLETMNRLGLAARRMIRLRTFKGVDVEGRPFKPYSDLYADKRAEMDLPTHPPDLRVEDVDGMLSDAVFRHVVSRNLDEIDLDIRDPERKKIAFYHDEAGVGKAGENIRHFWGLSERETKDIRDLLQEDVDRLINNIAADLSE